MIQHLYIHIPFCHHICPYCAFYKHKPGKLANEAFIEAILLEANQRARDLPDIRPRTIYFGGGTPSALSKKLLARLCEGIDSAFDLSELEEWTIESNPSTFDLTKAQLMKSLGITRPSLGVQSFQKDTLEVLGRDHSCIEAIQSYTDLVDAGFNNISIDLMFSIPGQTIESWDRDLQQAIKLDPTHISAYNLTYEEDTEFMEKHQTGELDFDEDRDASLFYHAIELLENHSFQHYETSNYAKPGYQSLHNQSYWHGNNYLGLGPSAVSTVDGLRWKTLPDTAQYVTQLNQGNDCRVDIEPLSNEDLRIERVALLLRTAKGLPRQYLSKGSQTTIDTLIDQGLVESVDDCHRLTKAGKALADPIAASLI